jgi:hypothetical protein
MHPEQNQSYRTLRKSIQGGFYFHPSDEDLSLGTPLREKPLEGFASGYTYSGSALARRFRDRLRAPVDEFNCLSGEKIMSRHITKGCNTTHFISSHFFAPAIG